MPEVLLNFYIIHAQKNNFAIHESRILKQARLLDHYVDLLRHLPLTFATPPWDMSILSKRDF